MVASGMDPKNDYVFKRILGYEKHVLVLIDLINAVVRPPAGSIVKQLLLLNPFTESDFAQEKVSILDVKARDELGRQFNLEMQLSVPWSFDKRIVYYLSRLHSSQMYKGDYYETICPTYAICFLKNPLFEDKIYHHVFKLYDAEHGILFSKDLQVHIIELEKFDLPIEQVQTALERWCYFLRHGATLDAERLPVQLEVPAIREAVEVLMELSQNERERIRAQDRLQGMTDAANILHEARNARQKGLEEGRWIGRIQLYQEQLGQPVTQEKDLIQLSLDELKHLADELKRQMTKGVNPS